MATPRNVSYILAGIDKALAFEWIVDRMDPAKVRLDFRLLGERPGAVSQYLSQRGIPWKFYPCTGRKGLPATTFRLWRDLRRNPPDAVHCHLLNANLAGLTAAKWAGVKQRIYTRHHSTFHWDYHPRAVRYDKYANRMATHIGAISPVVRQVLEQREGVAPQKITDLPHGFDLEAFAHVPPARVERLRHQYDLPETAGPVVGVIARWMELKGLQYIVPAFAEFRQHYPGARLVLAGAGGPYTPQVKALLAQLPRESYREIRFEPDLFALYQLFDAFVHVPTGPQIEAFGQIYVEALAAGVPSVFTLSGIAHEFIVHQENALVVPYKDEAAILRALLQLQNEPGLRRELIRKGQQSVDPQFSIGNFINNLEALYLAGE